MNFTHRLAVSYYKTIAIINETHKIYLVQHQETHQIFVKKILDVYNIHIYEYLYKHPVIGTPKIIEFCEEDHRLIVIEEYISGVSLENKIQQHTLSASDIHSYMSDLCTIFQQLHHAEPPIIHRDIKPSNIIIGCYNRAILLDFNAAKFYSPESSEDTVLLGTQGYAAPEQYGFGASSPQTDIYALGIILKEMSDSLSTPCHLFDTMIETCTKLTATERYQSANELKEALESPDKLQPLQNLRNRFYPYRLPGYRSKTPWKMILASIYYLLAAWLCLSLQVSDTQGFLLFLNRLCAFVIMIFWVLSCFNYRNVQCFFPLCKSKNRFLRYFGISVLNIIVSFFCFVVLFILEGLCTALS